VAEQVTFPVASTDESGGQVVISSNTGDGSSSGSAGDVVVYTRQSGVYTCLLTGSDEGGQRADTIMLGCFDTNSQTASLISIPRDTLVLKNGKNSKINAVYSSGKGEAMAEAVSDMLGVPVDYYVSVDLDAFKAIVKAIGGVEFNVPINMDYDDPTQDLHIHLKKGAQKLNAEQAMGVVRFRHNNDGSGYTRQDLDRVETQRNFLKAVIKQTITLSNVTKVTELIGILNQYVDTNMPLDTMVYFATSAIGMDLDTALTTATLPGEWNSPYMVTDPDEALELVNELLPVYTEPITKSIMNIRQK
jgi:LCP family protein required for cell wall assembly